MNTTNSSGIDKGYDYNGAAIYTAGILIYYSTGLVLMLFFHVRPRELQNQSIFDHEEADQSIKFSKNPFAHYNHVQTNNTQKQILNELKDPERRERLWKIYYSSREKHKEPHPQYYQTVATESATIGRINRKLATIHQMSRNSDADVIPTVNLSSSNSSTNFLAKSFNSLRRFSGQGRAQPPRPIVRVQSEPETPSLEFHPINFNIEPQVTSINERSNVQQTKIYLNRFTIERVSDEDLNLSIENKT